MFRRKCNSTIEHQLFHNFQLSQTEKHCHQFPPQSMIKCFVACKFVSQNTEKDRQNQKKKKNAKMENSFFTFRLTTDSRANRFLEYYEWNGGQHVTNRRNARLVLSHLDHIFCQLSAKNGHSQVVECRGQASEKPTTFPLLFDVC